MEQNEKYINLFEQLKKIRLSKNISLKTIARDSRIQVSYLEAIESGEFEKIPEVYDKLFFQTYISYLNVDEPDKYLAEFKALRKEIYYPTPTTTIQRIKTINTKKNTFLNLKTVFFVGPAVLLVIIIGFLAWNSKLVGDSSDGKIKELPVRKIVEDIEAKEKAISDSLFNVANESKEIRSGSVSISMTAIDTTWLRYVKDNKDTIEYTMHPGNTISIEADSSVQFLIGNAGGVNFSINGVNKGLLGKKGEVVSYLKVTPNGIAAMRTKKINN
jgi:transcriptional regulator with XRE-family HTH domain